MLHYRTNIILCKCLYLEIHQVSVRFTLQHKLLIDIETFHFINIKLS